MAWRSSKDPLLSTPLYRRNREVLKRQGCRVLFVGARLLMRCLASLSLAMLWRGIWRIGLGGHLNKSTPWQISAPSVGGVRFGLGRGRGIRCSVLCVSMSGPGSFTGTIRPGGEGSLLWGVGLRDHLGPKVLSPRWGLRVRKVST